MPGDIVLLEEGDFVPADCRLIEAFGLRVNTATVTGESLPKARNAEPIRRSRRSSQATSLLAGTSVVSGQARAVVFATGMRTEFGKIAHLTQTAASAPRRCSAKSPGCRRIVAMLASGSACVFFLIGQALGLPFWENLLFAIGIIVANVPEGLLPTVTLSLAMATQRMAQAQRAGAPPAGGGDAGLDHGDLLRQDRHADAEPHVGAALVAGRRILRRRTISRRSRAWQRITARSS